LVSAFGNGFASNIDATSVTVQDADGVTRTATLLYASPKQINFQIPAGTSSGISTVTITNTSTVPPASFTSRVQIAPVTPAIFQLNKAGLTAAYIVRVSGGTQSVEPIYTTQNGNVVPLPIDLGSSSDEVFLSIFGTGLRNSPGSQVLVWIGGLNAPVTYAGPQLTLVGLDQVNVLLPRQLAGSGQAGIVLNAAGHTGNTTYIFFK
jgi:uncharacterized protein (TIGR03437 family)